MRTIATLGRRVSKSGENTLKTTVIGLNLNRWFALPIDLREKGAATDITGVDCNEEHCRQARNRGLADRIEKLDSALIKPDLGLVILAIPVDGIVGALAEDS